MSRRQTLRYDAPPLPRIWLMTDPRFGKALLSAIQRLPARSGVIFRHYDLPDEERRALFRNVRRICMRRGHVILLAGDERTAQSWHAHGFHARKGARISRAMIHSAPVHNRRELAEAQRYAVDLMLISPVFATNSHLGVRYLGRTHFNALASQAGGAKVIALGGMTATKAAILTNHGVYGWAAIDAFRR